MNDTYIVTAYVVLDDLLKMVQYEDDRRAQLSAAEILTVAVVAAKYFQNLTPTSSQGFLPVSAPS